MGPPTSELADHLGVPLAAFAVFAFNAWAVSFRLNSLSSEKKRDLTATTETNLQPQQLPAETELRLN